VRKERLNRPFVEKRNSTTSQPPKKITKTEKETINCEAPKNETERLQVIKSKIRQFKKQEKTLENNLEQLKLQVKLYSL